MTSPPSRTRRVLATLGWLLVVGAGIAIYRLVVLPGRQADVEPTHVPTPTSTTAPDGPTANRGAPAEPSNPRAGPTSPHPVTGQRPDAGGSKDVTGRPDAPGDSTRDSLVDAGAEPVQPAEKADTGQSTRDAASAEGFLSRDEIKDVIGSMKPAVKVCYDKMLKDFPDADGKIILNFTIVGDGDTGRVDLEKVADDSTLQETRLNECLIEALRNLEFPVPDGDGEVTVRYPFAFRNAE